MAYTKTNHKSFSKRKAKAQRIDKLAWASPISGIGRRILWEFDLKLEQSKHKDRMTPGQWFELDTKSLDILLQIL